MFRGTGTGLLRRTVTALFKLLCQKICRHLHGFFRSFAKIRTVKFSFIRKRSLVIQIRIAGILHITVVCVRHHIERDLRAGLPQPLLVCLRLPSEPVSLGRDHQDRSNVLQIFCSGTHL